MIAAGESSEDGLRLPISLAVPPLSVLDSLDRMFSQVDAHGEFAGASVVAMD
jgi:hypothetical protein